MLMPHLRPVLALRGGHSAAPAMLVQTLVGATGSTTATAAQPLVARLLGYLMTLGSLLLYSPMILQVVRSRSGAGLSATSWTMSAFGFAGALVYQASCGYPINTYGELIALTIQSVALLVLILAYDRKVQASTLTAGTVAFGAAIFALITRAPRALLRVLQAVSGSMLAVAILPQLYLNFQSRTCGWSRISALLSTGGNSIRIYTTLSITKDKLVLAGFIAGFTLNLVLLTQTIVLPNPTAESS